jgi:hypothetical protein
MSGSSTPWNKERRIVEGLYILRLASTAEQIALAYGATPYLLLAEARANREALHTPRIAEWSDERGSFHVHSHVGCKGAEELFLQQAKCNSQR